MAKDFKDPDNLKKLLEKNKQVAKKAQEELNKLKNAKQPKKVESKKPAKSKPAKPKKPEQVTSLSEKPVEADKSSEPKLPAEIQQPANLVEQSAEQPSEGNVIPDDPSRLGPSTVENQLQTPTGVEEDKRLKLLNPMEREEVDGLMAQGLDADEAIQRLQESKASDLPVEQPAPAETAQPIESETPEEALASTTEENFNEFSDAVDKGKEDNAVAAVADQVEKESNLEKIKEEQRVLKNAMADLHRQNSELEAIDPDRFWNSRSTGQKIMAGIGMLFGGKEAVSILTSAIDRDIKSQKLNREQELARRQHALKLVSQRMDAIAGQIVDPMKQQRAVLQNQKLMLEIDKINKQRVEVAKDKYKKSSYQEALASGRPLTRREVAQLDPKEQDKMIKLKNGWFKVFGGPKDVTDVKGRVVDAESAIKTINELEEIGKEAFGGAFNPFSRKRAKVNVTTLTGKLRLELFGPGVMTDFEQGLAKEIIGNTTGFLSLTALQLEALKSLKTKLIYSTKQHLKKSGIDVQSKNDKMIKQLIASGRAKNEAVATKILNANKMWEDETEF